VQYYDLILSAGDGGLANANWNPFGGSKEAGKEQIGGKEQLLEILLGLGLELYQQKYLEDRLHRL
jgi:hypothetical protein